MSDQLKMGKSVSETICEWGDMRMGNQLRKSDSLQLVNLENKVYKQLPV